jgi:hypothetical protein
MISNKQLKANRRNAQIGIPARPYPRNAEAQSGASGQGPKTDAGKQRSSLNATRHSLTGQVTVMTDQQRSEMVYLSRIRSSSGCACGQDREAFTAFSGRMMKSLAPEGELEIQLALRLVKDIWRLNRLSAVEDNLFALGHSDNGDSIHAEHPQAHAALVAAFTFKKESKQIELLSLYEQRLNPALQKNLAAFRGLQAERKQECAKEMGEAELLLQLSAINGLNYEPAKDGFVFSNAQITTAIDRAHRLKQAHAHINYAAAPAGCPAA